MSLGFVHTSVACTLRWSGKRSSDLNHYLAAADGAHRRHVTALAQPVPMFAAKYHSLGKPRRVMSSCMAKYLGSSVAPLPWARLRGPEATL
jgi:hypothetical protein